jgi:hypothetical protein
MHLYCTLLNTTLDQLKILIETRFPENTTQMIESGRIFLSDGDNFECSIEPNEDGKGLYLSAEYPSPTMELDAYMIFWEEALDTISAIYNLEIEAKRAGEYYSQTVIHPDFQHTINSNL